MILQQDVTFLMEPEFGTVTELAFRLHGLEVLPSTFVVNDLYSIEPVLNMISIHDQFAGIELSRRVQLFFC